MRQRKETTEVLYQGLVDQPPFAITLFSNLGLFDPPSYTDRCKIDPYQLTLMLLPDAYL